MPCKIWKNQKFFGIEYSLIDILWTQYYHNIPNIIFVDFSLTRILITCNVI